MIFSPRWFKYQAERCIQRWYINQNRSHQAVAFSPPGHFYSPLLDLNALGPNDEGLFGDGEDYWEHIDLRPDAQRHYFQSLLTTEPRIDFPDTRGERYRYYGQNQMLVYSDAFTLSSILIMEKPKRVIEVGSGFSSAVMLDTLDATDANADLLFIEPYPDRLNSLLRPQDANRTEVLVRPVQDVPLSRFDALQRGDVLFIDSSHVAKIGSDLSFLLLRVLPRLADGVLIHFHDIIYPYTLPAEWIRQGRAWNESLFLRAFLIGNPDFEMLAFNSYAGQTFPELFERHLPRFLSTLGGSVWLRKAAR